MVPSLLKRNQKKMMRKKLKNEKQNCSFRISDGFGFRKEQWHAVRYLLKSERYSETFEKAPDLQTHCAKLSRTLRLCKTANAEREPNKKARRGPPTTKTKQIISRYYHQKAVDNTTLPSHHPTSRSRDGVLDNLSKASHNLLSFSGCLWNSSLP